MIKLECDRCGKALEGQKGYSFHIAQSHFRQNGIRGDVNGNPFHMPQIWQGEICEGCFSMLHFFFNEKFREDSPLVQ